MNVKVVKNKILMISYKSDAVARINSIYGVNVTKYGLNENARNRTQYILCKTRLLNYKKVIKSRYSTT